MIIYPKDKKSFVEVQQFKYLNCLVERRIVWRYGELTIDPDNGEVQLSHCYDKSHVESVDQYIEQIHPDKSEAEVLDELNELGYKLLDTWYEINGRFEIRL